MSVREVMARALYDVHWADKHVNPEWEAMPENAQDVWLRRVDAQLSALREAGYEIKPPNPRPQGCRARPDGRCHYDQCPADHDRRLVPSGSCALLTAGRLDND